MKKIIVKKKFNENSERDSKWHDIFFFLKDKKIIKITASYKNKHYFCKLELPIYEAGYLQNDYAFRVRNSGNSLINISYKDFVDFEDHGNYIRIYTTDNLVFDIVYK